MIAEQIEATQQKRKKLSSAFGRTPQQAKGCLIQFKYSLLPQPRNPER